MGRVETALKRQIGPLPAWAWAGVLFLALYAYRALRGQTAPRGADTGASQEPLAREVAPIAPLSPLGEAGTGDELSAGGPAPIRQVFQAAAQAARDLGAKEVQYDPATGVVTVTVPRPETRTPPAGTMPPNRKPPSPGEDRRRQKRTGAEVMTGAGPHRPAERRPREAPRPRPHFPGDKDRRARPVEGKPEHARIRGLNQ